MHRLPVPDVLGSTSDNFLMAIVAMTVPGASSVCREYI